MRRAGSAGSGAARRGPGQRNSCPDDAYQEHGLLFCRADGWPIYPETITDHFNRLVGVVRTAPTLPGHHYKLRAMTVHPRPHRKSLPIFNWWSGGAPH